MRRLILAVVLVTALFSSAVRLPASACPIASAPMGKSCKMGCCASKACCVDSQKNKALPSQPLVKSSATHDLTAIAAPALMVAAFSVHCSHIERDSGLSEFAISTPRQALLCTFLI